MGEQENKFQKGDFLRRTYKEGIFMIYEGNNLSDTAYKKMSLVCYYDPDAYVRGDFGYESRPNLEVGDKYRPCETTVDTEEETYYVKKCNDEEIERALNILAQHGLYWDKENLELVRMDTGEIIRKIAVPDDTYHGEVIKPTSIDFKELAKKYCSSKLKPSYTRTYGCGYGADYYDD